LEKAEKYYSTATDLAPIPLGSLELAEMGIQDFVSIRIYGTSWRNRHHIRPLHEIDVEEGETEMSKTEEDEIKEEKKARELLRISRIKKPPIRFGTDTVIL